MKSVLDYSNGDTVAITCGRCHQGNHTKRRCVDPPCTTSISCGKIKFHKTELKVIESKKVQLKKLIREKVSLESESKKIRETIASTVKTFPQAIKTALINSNKKEYLTIHDGKFVPLTMKINRDISILQKYYNGLIPNDLEQESSLFQTIIAEANKRFQVNSFTVEQKLEETLSAIHTRITANTCSGPTIHTNCITVDSSPEINSHSRTTTPVDITSPLSSIVHENVTTNPKNSCILNSPPTKLPESATNVSLHDSKVDQVVTNFQKLDSPSKDIHDPVDNNTSEINTGACKTPVPTTKSNVNFTTNSSPLKPVMNSTNKPTFDVFPPQHTHSYYPYLYPTPPIQPYPYAIVPLVHNPYGTGKSSTESSPSSTCNKNWRFSQFNRPALSFDSKQNDKHPQTFYHSEIKPHVPSFNFGMTLPQSPYPWFPNQSMDIFVSVFLSPQPTVCMYNFGQ